jgi:hypothetical protein
LIAQESDNANLIIRAKPPVGLLAMYAGGSIGILFGSWFFLTASDAIRTTRNVILFLFLILGGVFSIASLFFYLWRRIRKTPVFLIDETGVTSFGIFRSNHFKWSEISRILEEYSVLFIWVQSAKGDGKAKPFYIRNVDVSNIQIITAIAKYRPDLISPDIFKHH